MKPRRQSSLALVVPPAPAQLGAGPRQRALPPGLHSWGPCPWTPYTGTSRIAAKTMVVIHAAPRTSLALFHVKRASRNGASRGQDHHETMRLDTLGLRTKSGRQDRVMNDLALERGHRLHRQLFAGGLHGGDDALGNGHQGSATFGPVPGDVEHEPAPLAGRRLDREPGELLQRLQNLAVRAHQPARDAALLGVHDGHCRTVTVDVYVDVAVHVGDVQELLEKVGRNLTLTYQSRCPR